MIHYIITGHANYATAMRSAIEAICGEQECLSYIDYDTTKPLEELKRQYLQTVKHGEQYIFVCDLAGATPFTVSSMLFQDHQNVRVVAGINLAAILEAIYIREDSLSEICKTMINATKTTALCFKMNAERKKKKEGGI
ncbi:PTS sugar transporter subunit IIA [Massilicoli timonensis]|uniref:PTS sugar transporter subunit IIA n=1 Tax=Massilicoli timonensis TaxID=2015901 RepID=UPI0023EFA886|nr:PTS sugar transporter subunit IIA [Massilicoli timonensis]